MISIGNRALDRAGMTREEVPGNIADAQELVDQAQVDIDEISIQIALDEANGGARGEDWLNRAMRARSYAYGKRRIGLRVVRTLTSLERQKAHQKAAEELAHSIAKAKADRQEAAQRWEISLDSARLKAVRNLLKTMPKEAREPFYRAMDEAEAEFIAHTPTWRDMPPQQKE